MTGILFITVNFIFQHSRYYIVFRISVGKSVRHYQIKHIACCKSFNIGTFTYTFLKFIWYLSNLTTFLEYYIKLLCLRFIQVKINDKIIGIGLSDYFLQINIFTGNRDFGGRYVIAVK